VVKADDIAGEEPQEVVCEYYTPKEVATILNLSMDVVYDLLRDGKMPAINLGTGKRRLWRIPKHEFVEYITSVHRLPEYDEDMRLGLKAKLRDMQRTRGTPQEDEEL